jgi:hypothetical protein
MPVSQGIKFEVVGDNQKAKIKDVLIEGYGTKHAFIYGNASAVENTGYFINNRLWYPGDAFTNPHRYAEILALPVAGPWLTIANAIDYGTGMKPKICFPVHDGMFAPEREGPIYRLPGEVFNQAGINYLVFEIGKEYEF